MVDLFEQLAALLEIHNGEDQAADSFLLAGAWLVPASTIETDYRSHVDNAVQQNLLDVVDPANFRASGSVYPSLWRSGWIPFLEVGKDPWAIDLDPHQGTEGQVISMQIENGVVAVKASSVEGLLSRYLDSLRGLNATDRRATPRVKRATANPRCLREIPIVTS